MPKKGRHFPRVTRNLRGAAMTEYALLASLLGTSAVVALRPLGLEVYKTYHRVGEHLSGSATSPVGGGETETPPVDPMILTFSGNAVVTFGGAVAASIDWGDGTIQEVSSSGVFTHSYASPGTYQVQIEGAVDLFGSLHDGHQAGSESVMHNLVSVNSFGNLGIRKLDHAFAGTNQLTPLPTSLPSSVVSLAGLFYKSGANPTGLEHWQTGQVQSLFLAFAQATAFNRDISAWNTASVTDMSYAFEYTEAFTAGIGSWVTSSVTTFEGMFQYSTFNQPIGTWDTSSATDMDWMFIEAGAFNQPIGAWDTSSVTEFDFMFLDAAQFNQDLSGWCVAQFPVEPDYWSLRTYAWTLPKPAWGTCP